MISRLSDVEMSERYQQCCVFVVSYCQTQAESPRSSSGKRYADDTLSRFSMSVL